MLLRCSFLRYGFMRFIGLVLLGVLALSGCDTIEHRSETIKKLPLPALPEKKLNHKLVWSNTKSAGVSKSDAKLRLAVVNDSVYAADNKGRLYALDRKTGAVKWQQTVQGNITAGPAFAMGRVLVGTKNAKVLSFNAFTGAKMWQTEVSGPVLATPQGSGNLVFVHSLDGNLTALNASNGEEQWRYAVHHPLLVLSRSSSPVIVNNQVIVGFASGKLVSLNSADGMPNWTREVAVSKGRSDLQRMVDISGDPIVRDNIVYSVSYQGHVTALALGTGLPLWSHELSSYAGLAVANQALFVSGTDGVVSALNRTTGKVLWQQPALKGRGLSAPAVFRDYVIVGDDDGNLHWLTAQDGSLIGRVMVDSKGIDATPVIKDNHIYVLGRGGKIAVYTL